MCKWFKKLLRKIDMKCFIDYKKSMFHCPTKCDCIENDSNNCEHKDKDGCCKKAVQSYIEHGGGE